MMRVVERIQIAVTQHVPQFVRDDGQEAVGLRVEA